MSVGAVIGKAVAEIAAAAAGAVVRQMVAPDEVAHELDKTAERIRFDAEGQRMLDARRKARGK